MDLSTLRQEIDTLDREIINLISKRFKCIVKVAQYKKANGFEALQSKRWQEVLDSRKKQAKELGIDENMIENIWDMLHDFALIKEKEIINN